MERAVFEVIPAIDLQGGRCVRLVQGDFAQQTVYSDDPVAMARSMQAAGAPRLHVVDLDGARDGLPSNRPVIAAIAAALQIPLQVGGGMRSRDDVAATLALGVDRVILGTAAVRDPQLTAALLAEYGARIVIGIDARDGLVATEGWLTTSSVRATELVAQMTALGAQTIIYTDISRDGMLSEPNYAALTQLIRADGPTIIASGGVSRVDQVSRLAELGAGGVIIGKAIYTGHVDLEQAIAAGRRDAA
jgi:phosphoribosylformimino-5-aminoimidazole carboxamide ribotide isomerase